PALTTERDRRLLDLGGLRLVFGGGLVLPDLRRCGGSELLRAGHDDDRRRRRRDRDRNDGRRRGLRRRFSRGVHRRRLRRWRLAVQFGRRVLHGPGLLREIVERGRNHAAGGQRRGGGQAGEERPPPAHSGRQAS